MSDWDKVLSIRPLPCPTAVQILSGWSVRLKEHIIFPTIVVQIYSSPQVPSPYPSHKGRGSMDEELEGLVRIFGSSCFFFVNSCIKDG